jgi:hypothetical protein
MTVALLASMALLSQCSEDDGFIPDVDLGTPDSISILSGNNQYARHGTTLPDPLVVKVKTAEGAGVPGVAVTFTPTQGGGVVSTTSEVTDGTGRASTQLTLGTSNGINRVMAKVDSDPSLWVDFSATSSDFFCPEAEDSLQVCGGCASRYGPKDDLFLVTAHSSLFPDNAAGVVQVKLAEVAQRFADVPPDQGFFTPVVWDGVFSPRGDYYIARRTIFPQILKIAIDGSISVFAPLEASSIDDSVELAANPVGLLMGCDIKGPFFVRCRELSDPPGPPGVIERFAEASYTDEINNDALAVDPRRQSDDPLGEDVYFINKSDLKLYRLPLDNLSVEPQGLHEVAQLTFDQAVGARGMACDDSDGSVYILVDTDDTKELLKVTTGGVVSQLFDFFSRGGGTAQEAGMQRDLVFRAPWLITLDTLNDKLLIYQAGTLNERFSDPIEQAKLSERDAGGNLSGGERVGLDILR